MAYVLCECAFDYMFLCGDIAVNKNDGDIEHLLAIVSPYLRIRMQMATSV